MEATSRWQWRCSGAAVGLWATQMACASGASQKWVWGSECLFSAPSHRSWRAPYEPDSAPVVGAGPLQRQLRAQLAEPKFCLAADCSCGASNGSGVLHWWQLWARAHSNLRSVTAALHRVMVHVAVISPPVRLVAAVGRVPPTPRSQHQVMCENSCSHLDIPHQTKAVPCVRALLGQRGERERQREEKG